jgi:hypothetical protein
LHGPQRINHEADVFIEIDLQLLDTLFDIVAIY